MTVLVAPTTRSSSRTAVAAIAAAVAGAALAAAQLVVPPEVPEARFGYPFARRRSRRCRWRSSCITS